jgi:hypothetical protein
MLKAKIYSKSSIVDVVKISNGEKSNIGSLGRAKNRQRDRKSKLEDFRSEVDKLQLGLSTPPTADQEAEIRSMVEKSCRKNLILKAELLNIAGLNLNDRDKTGLAREAKEAASYPDLDLFTHESRAKLAIHLLFESFVKDGERESFEGQVAADNLATVLILIMLMHGVSDIELAIEFTLNAVHLGYGIRNEPMVSTFFESKTVGGAPDKERVKNKLNLSRSVLKLLSQLREKTSPVQLKNMLTQKQFSEAVSRRLAFAAISKTGGHEEQLKILSDHISCLQTMYVPPCFRELFGGGLVSTPLPPVLDYHVTTKSYPKDIPVAFELPSHYECFIDSLLVQEGQNRLSDALFVRQLRQCIRDVESRCLKGAEQRRLNLSVEVEKLLFNLQEDHCLSMSQRLLGAFVWLMAMEGIPATSLDVAVGQLSTISNYLDRVWKIVSEVYAGDDIEDADEEKWQEVLTRFRENGKYDKDRADRLQYFLDCVDKLELTSVPASSIVYENIDAEAKPALSQLISLRSYEHALLMIKNDYDTANVLEAILLCIFMYRGGGRFGEVHSLKFGQVLISPSSKCISIGGRGNDKPKNKNGNRWAELLGDLHQIEIDALESFDSMRKTQKIPPNQYIFKSKDNKYIERDKARMQRKLNGLFKAATGNPKARCHDNRKSNINHVILTILSGGELTTRLAQLCQEKIIPKIRISESLKPGGSRYAFWGEAVASRYGHSCFDVTVKNYVVYASEIYQFFWSQIGLNSAIRDSMHFLSAGELNTPDVRYEFLERGRSLCGMEKLLPPTILHPKNLAAPSISQVIEPSFRNIALMLSGSKPDNISILEMCMGQNRKLLEHVHETALEIAKDLGFTAYDDDIEFIDYIERRKSFFTVLIPSRAMACAELVLSTKENGLYLPGGVWQRAYRSEEGRRGKVVERYVLTTEESIRLVVGHCLDLGFRASSLNLSCLDGGEMACLAENLGVQVEVRSKNWLRSYSARDIGKTGVLSITRDTASGIQYMAILNKVAMVESVRCTLAGQCNRELEL